MFLDSGKTGKELNYKKFVVNSRLQYFKPHATKIEQSFGEEVAHSLTQEPKFLSPKFFYDKNGSCLFEQICDLDEYYLARTEISILKDIQKELESFITNSFRLVEFGSGSSVKTRLVLDVLDKNLDKIEYIPIDISEILTETSKSLLGNYENLSVTGIINTY